MVIWGGASLPDRNTGATFNPVTNTWTALATAAAPDGRRDFVSAWTNTNRLIVWGGNNDIGAGYLGDGAQLVTLSLYRKN
jgi:hypothetical protein